MIEVTIFILKFHTKITKLGEEHEEEERRGFCPLSFRKAHAQPSNNNL
jgi:hypothetical protein